MVAIDLTSCNHTTHHCHISCNELFSCSNTFINITNINNLSLQCNGDYSCQDLQVLDYSNYSELPDNKDISVSCRGTYSCHSSTFNIPNTRLSINIFDSCPNELRVLCNINEVTSECDILCLTKSIEILSNSFQLITQTDHCIDQSIVSFCGDQQRTNLLQCTTDESKQPSNNQNITTITKWQIDTMTLSQTDTNDTCQSLYVSESDKIYFCDPQTDCSLNCDILNCDGVTINASMANSLSLQCKDSKNCKNMNIIIGNFSLNWTNDNENQPTNTPISYSPTTTRSTLIPSNYPTNKSIFMLPTTKRPTFPPTTKSPTNYPAPTTYRPTYYPTKEPTVQPTYTTQFIGPDTFFIISIVVGGIASLLLLTAIIFCFYHCITYLHKKRHNKYISNKPSVFFYVFSGIADDVIMGAMYWWLIKCWAIYLMLNPEQDDYHHYCDETYPDEEAKAFCNTDGFCSYYCEDGDCMCYGIGGADNDMLALCIIWTIFAAFHAGFLFYRWCTGCRFCVDGPQQHGVDGCIDDYTSATYCNHDCCLLCLAKGKHGPKSRDYLERRYWKGRGCEKFQCMAFRTGSTGAPWIRYFFDNFINYGIFIMFAWIYIEMIDIYVYQQLHGFDFYTIFALIIIKIGLQIWYSFGDDYDKKKDEYHQRLDLETKKYKKMMKILNKTFGEDPARIIYRYLPYYYSDECPVELRVNNVRRNKRRKVKKRQKTKSKTYELVYLKRDLSDDD